MTRAGLSPPRFDVGRVRVGATLRGTAQLNPPRKQTGCCGSRMGRGGSRVIHCFGD
ncbi:hypothetical protein PSTT_02646 [Puccinia striiformis]|uniref:Uncharacterized protein n=1 Tax=Puccinia striiformis TaxID=27350 RepID=A0A2S4VZ87_9BASI|nr:hypothetical protein PSTT_02646 [Puccinia striiformis]